MQADRPGIVTPTSWGNVDLISEIFKPTPSDGSGPTEGSVILYCPKSNNGTNHSETFSVVRTDGWRGLVSAVTEGLDKSMESAYTRLKHDKPWYDTVQSEDIAKQVDLELISIFQNSLIQYPYSSLENGRISVQKGWPIRAIYPLDERLSKKLREYEDYGYVFLDENEIKTFRSIMDELPSIPGRPIKSSDTHGSEVTVSSATEIPDPSNCERSVGEDMVITNDDDDEDSVSQLNICVSDQEVAGAGTQRTAALLT
ncbi:hypothetical protein V865_006271 [Kwoniella europaea PYCC6329]|uniref:Uncharacterized protein n=1 Tax=Kwoniella europaea PYCC6329 TaxID=1423913 RepID=A0AAX4KRH6_9TREE